MKPDAVPDSVTTPPVFVNDAVNAAVSAEVADEMVSANMSRVLVIYTGGTIGMKNTPTHGYLPVPGYLSHTLAAMTRFHDPVGFAATSATSTTFPLTNAVNIPLAYPNDSPKTANPLGHEAGDDNAARFAINGTPVIRSRKPALVTPASLYGKRIRYSILEYDPLLDSANMTMSDWVKIATDIEVNYRLFDAFIVLHGTDTMAFTASALSFMMENLGKTIILTGSQVPLAEVRNDAVDNLLGALTIAGHFIIPEVGLFFGHKLFRGNRSSKVDAVDFSAFDSPNLRPLVSVGINIGITEATVRAFLSPPIKGVVLETYGSGNAPNNRPDILAAMKEASDRGVVIVNCTQCKRGLVTDIYATGKALLEINVVPGSDMTPECALTKLSYLLGHSYSPAECRNLIRKNLRGELTAASRRQRFAYNQGGHGLVHNVLSLLGGEAARLGAHPDQIVDVAAHEADSAGMEKALVPMLMCHAARVGDLAGLAVLTGEYQTMVNIGDFDGRTPLHVAACENNYSVVEFLLRNGSTVHIRDRFGHSPLWDAAQSGHAEIAKLLRHAGAHFAEDEMDEVACRLARAVMKNDIQSLKLWVDCGADLNRPWQDLRTPLHLAVSNSNTAILAYILTQALQISKSQSRQLSNRSPSPALFRPSTPTLPDALKLPTTGLYKLGENPSGTMLPWLPEIKLDPVDLWGRTPADEARRIGGTVGEEMENMLKDAGRKMREVIKQN
ncbi:hypothetical protein HK104_008387 [Borealophlyctis nickersoniae]|nr:hypothetical protein HK104_008387 [Borealophlyctis nickersoniae]